MENIMILTSKLNGGGAERCASNMSVELSKNFNVFLVAFDGNNVTYPYGGTFIDLKIKNTTNYVKKIINVFRRIIAVRKIKKRNNISCAISLLDGPNIVNVLSRKNEKTIVSIRNMLSSENTNILRKKMICYCSKKADKTVALSKMVKLDLIKNFDIPEKKIITIYNHCDPVLLHKLIEKEPKPKFIENNYIYIVTMGRLNVQKGQWHLIRAFKKVEETIPNAKLVIIGEGELKEKLEKLVTDLKLDGKVIFAGYIPNPHIVLKYSEIFVFPSIFEGLGNVLLEALAFEMPIISTDCVAGPREILAPDSDLLSSAQEIECEKYGVLVPKMDYGNFNSLDELTKEELIMAEAIIKLHENEDLRKKYSSLSKERIKNFSPDKITNEWESCIS